MGETKHLWECDHPYYCNDDHYFGTGTCGTRPEDLKHHHASWSEFMSTMGDADLDMNLLFRWDWEEETPHPDQYYRNGELKLVYFMQRKGFHCSHRVSVCRADEPAVREWLAVQWEHKRRLWEPLGGEFNA